MIKITLGMMLFLCATSIGLANDKQEDINLPPIPTQLPEAASIHDSTQTGTKHLAPGSNEISNFQKTELSNAENASINISSDSLSKDIELRKLMLDWSRHLGVTCNHCHDTNNFKNDEKLSFKIGLKHKGLVRILNEEVFTERDKGGALKVVADCYMCHQGYSTPKFKEPPQNLMK